MTLDDAIDRACSLWGAAHIVQVKLRADGSADIGLCPVDTPDAPDEHHHLNAVGRPTCHADCRLVHDAMRLI